MNKKVKMSLGGTAAATTSMALLGFMPAANADTTIAPTTTVTNYSSSISTGAAVITNSAHVVSTGNTVYYIQAKGMTKAQKAAGKKKATKAKPPVITLPKAETLWTSYCRLPDGVGVDANQCLHVPGAQEVWHWKTYPAGHKFYLGADGYYHDGPCDNKAIVHLPAAPKLPKHAIKLTGKITVKKTSSYVSTASSKLTLTVTSYASASCGNTANGASATGYGYGYAYAYATETMRGSSKESAENAALAAANKAAQSVKFTDKQVENAETEAGGAATTMASASVVCTSTPTSTTPPPPPVVTPSAPSATLNTVNQVIEGDPLTTGLSVQVYGGDTATVTISALWGQITSTKVFNNISGSWSTTIGYTAPGEIPDGSQSFSGIPAPGVGNDQIKVVVVDNQTGKEDVEYTTFKITAPVAY